MVVDIGFLHFSPHAGVVVAVFAAAIVLKGLDRNREVAFRYSALELVVIGASIYYQLLVLSPPTGIDNLVDGATWFIVGYAVIKPFAGDLVTK